MARITLAVLISGRGSNLQAIIDSIESGKLDAEIRIVISDKPSAQGLIKARRNGIEAIAVGREKKFERIDEEIRKSGAELIVLAGFMRILPPWFVDRYYGRMINIHPSLLPSFPGLHAQRQALQYGVKITGCTIHFVDHGCDTGPIIEQVAVPVMAGDDEDSLSDRILIQEHRLLPSVIDQISKGKVSLKLTD